MCWIDSIKKSYGYSIWYWIKYKLQFILELLGVMIMDMVNIAWFWGINVSYLLDLQYELFADETQLRVDLVLDLVLGPLLLFIDMLISAIIVLYLHYIMI